MRNLFISNLQGKTIIAVVENQRTMELIVCNETNEAGNIYKGIVKESKEAMDAYFVQIDENRDGFLLRSDCLTQPLERGDEVAVQIIKEKSRFKSVKLTMKLAFPGSKLIYSPYADYVAASKKMTKHEREKWLAFANEHKRGHEGMIFRTAAMSSSFEEMEKELFALRRKTATLLKKSAHLQAPVLLYKGYDCIEQVLHDYSSSGLSELLTDNAEEYVKIKKIVERMEDCQIVVRLDLSSSFNLEKEVNLALKKVVWLPDGSYLLIEETESLTIIDVNSGKSASDAVRINKQAAREVARQLRLRNLGGMVVVDFIRMNKEEDKQTIWHEVEQAILSDRKTIKVFGFTHMGLFELTRKKTGGTLKENLMPRMIDNSHGS